MIGLSALGILAVALVPSVALADPAEEAEARFQLGLAAVDRGDYEGALREFQAARDLEESARVVYDIGSCLKALRRYAEALRAYERVVELGTDGLPEANRPNLARYLESLRARVAWLSVRPDPPDAAVTVDGQAVTRWPFAIDTGAEVVVEVTREGRTPARTTVRAQAPGSIEVPLALATEPPPPAPAPAPAPTPDRARRATDAARPETARPRERAGISLPWIVAGAAVVAGGIVGAIVLADGKDLGGDVHVTAP